MVTFRVEPRRSAVVKMFITTGCTYLRIESFKVHKLDHDWFYRRGIHLESNNTEIIDNHFYDIRYYPAILSKGELFNITVKNNLIERCNIGMWLGGTNVLFENNTIYRLMRTWLENETTINPGEDADYLRVYGNNITIRKNLFYGTDKVAGEVGGSHVDIIQNFHFFGEKTHAARNVLVENNIFMNYDEGVMSRTLDCEGSGGTEFPKYYLGETSIEVIQGSKTVTMDSRPPKEMAWYYGIVGRNIEIKGINYTVASTAEGFNLTSLELDRPYEGSSDTMVSYILHQPPDPCLIGFFVNWTLRNNVFARGGHAFSASFIENYLIEGNTLYDNIGFAIPFEHSTGTVKNNIIASAYYATLGWASAYDLDESNNIVYDWRSHSDYLTNPDNRGPGDIVDKYAGPYVLFVNAPNHIQALDSRKNTFTDITLGETIIDSVTYTTLTSAVYDFEDIRVRVGTNVDIRTGEDALTCYDPEASPDDRHDGCHNIEIIDVIGNTIILEKDVTNYGTDLEIFVENYNPSTVSKIYPGDNSRFPVNGILTYHWGTTPYRIASHGSDFHGEYFIIDGALPERPLAARRIAKWPEGHTNFIEDLHLREDSIAVDNGVRIPGFNNDIEGNDRNMQGPAWDTGAYEYISSLPCESTSDCSHMNNAPCKIYYCDVGGTDICTKTETDGDNCDDQNECTINDLCNAYACQGTYKCDDGIECTIDSCVSGGCQNTVDDNRCPEDTTCTDYSCSASLGCVENYADNGVNCDDGLFCTTGDDTCDGSGNCIGTPDNDQCRNEYCTLSVCDAVTGCDYLPAGCRTLGIPSDFSYYWPLDTDADELDGKNNGVLMGNARFGTDDVRGLVLQMDERDDYIELEEDYLDPNNHFSVSLWFRKFEPKYYSDHGLFTREVDGLSPFVIWVRKQRKDRDKDKDIQHYR